MSTSSFHDYIMADIFGGFNGITSRAMFGGYGIYRDGVFFALIADDQLYFKVDDSNRRQYEVAGSKPFIYHKNKKPMTMQYWLVPEDILNDRQQLSEWIDQSVDIALRHKIKQRKD